MDLYEYLRIIKILNLFIKFLHSTGFIFSNCAIDYLLQLSETEGHKHPFLKDLELKQSIFNFSKMTYTTYLVQRMQTKLGQYTLIKE